MKVSHEEDHITQAIIGGKESSDFGISDSPEFFHILSSTLYTDQILAVVREDICNAWDSHIASKITDTPIDITLSHRELIIRDYGAGIPRDKIKPIYCVYGNSTKKNDSAQTGGFGLGCKSPFAYTDNFTLKNYHDKKLTVYNLSKTSGNVQGKPSMTEIMTIPTEESGIEVIIQLKNLNDYHRYALLIHRVVQNGNIKAKLNGELLPTIDYSVAKENYVLTTDTLSDNSQALIYVLYGNVVYEVPRNEAYVEEYNALYNWIANINYKIAKDYKIIFLAKPNSISVTPSRETLSLQDHTINTIKQLISSFKERSINKKRMLHDYLTIAESLVNTENEHAIYSDKLLNSYYNKGDSLKVLGDSKDISDVYLRYIGVPYLDRITDFKKRINVMLKHNLGNKKLLISLRNFIIKYRASNPFYNQRYFKNITWLKRDYIYPLVAKIVKQGFNKNNLYIANSLLQNSSRVNVIRYGLIHYKDINASESIYAALAMRFNRIVITNSRSTIHDRMLNHPKIIESKGSIGYLVYICNKAKNAGQEEIDFFTKIGMDVLDMRERQDWEPAPVPKAKVTAPKKVGYTLLSNAINLVSQVDIDLLTKEGIRSEEADFYVRINKNRFDDRILDAFDINLSNKIIRKLGSRGVVAKTSPQEKVLERKGIVNLKQFVITYISNRIDQDCLMQQIFSCNIDNYKEPNPYLYNINTIKNINIICSILNIPIIDKDSEEYLMYEIYESLLKNSKSWDGVINDPDIKDLADKISQIPMNKNLEILYEKVVAIPAIKFLALDKIKAEIETNSPNKDIAETIICNALEINP